MPLPKPSALTRIARLSGVQRSLVVQALVLVATIRVSLWLLPFATVRRLFATSTRRVSSSNKVKHSEQITWAVTIASRYIPHATCLVQALAAQVLLARNSVQSQLHIGVAKGSDGKLQAHAWVECDGQNVLGGFTAERYAPLLALKGLATQGEAAGKVRSGNGDIPEHNIKHNT